MKEKKQKPKPRKCVCGKLPVLVSVRGGADAQLPGSDELRRESSYHVAENDRPGYGRVECSGSGVFGEKEK